MSATRRKAGPRPRTGPHAPRRDDYAHLATRPLYILVFLAPLIVYYEIGSALYLTDAAAGAVETIRAYRQMSGFFHAFGVSGLFIPGILLAVIMILWHIFSRDRWEVRPGVLLGMLAESLLWTLPLIILGQIFARFLPGADGQPLAGALAAAGGGLLTLPPAARLTIAIGAGLYEELLFRLVAIAGIHAVAVDIAGLKPRLGGAIAVVGAAAIFALYHDSLPGPAIAWSVVAFPFIAGLYFGVIYLWRGFGIVAAVHALFDLAVLVLLAPNPAA